MTRVPRVFIGAVIFLLSAVAYAGPVSTDLFSVTLPDAYTAPVMSTATQNGIKTSTWIAKVPATGEAVVISVSTMPGKIEDPAKTMDSTRDSLLKSVKGTLDSEQTVAGPLPTRDLLFKSGTAFLRSRLVVSGDDLYQMLYVGRSQAERDAPAVGQMFNSFTVKTPAVTSTTVTTTTSTTTTQPAPVPAPAPVPPPK